MIENPSIKAIPDKLPDAEILRLLHGAAWNYKNAHSDIHKALDLLQNKLPV